MEIDPMTFIKKLLYFRAVFDKYIIKIVYDEKQEDKYKWSLQCPNKTSEGRGNKGNLIYKNTFEDTQQQTHVIKCLSMLQVTYRMKKYKNWLHDVLHWFQDSSYFYISGDDYQYYLDELVCKYFDKNTEYTSITNETYYSKGTDTPHFLFNFIDYLYWVKGQKNGKNEFEFDFKYRNSIEHHRPQSWKMGISDEIIDCLGNLCLISKSTNSRLNNEEPIGKVNKYYDKKLPPKRKIMYELTRNSSNELKWSKEEIISHYYDVVDLLHHRRNILNLE
jgi:hypothetical protein